jgi:hypothetical protein
VPNDKSKLIFGLSEFLPPLSESVTDLIAYVQTEGQFDDQLLNKLGEVIVHTDKIFQTLKVEGESDEGVNSLRTNIYDGIISLQRGIKELIYLIAYDRGMNANSLDLFKDSKQEEVELYTSETAINYLFKGSMKIAEAIDRLFKND